MDIHLDWHEILEALVRLPVLWVLAGGLLFGVGATQLIKKTWLAWGHDGISEARYKISVRWLSALSTYGFTLGLWHNQLGHGGLEEVVCAGWGLLSPLAYDGARAAVATRWPTFAAHWGAADDGRP